MIVAAIFFSKMVANAVLVLMSLKDKRSTEKVLDQFGPKLTVETFTHLFEGQSAIESMMRTGASPHMFGADADAEAGGGGGGGSLAPAGGGGLVDRARQAVAALSPQQPAAAPAPHGGSSIGRQAFITQMLLLLGKIEEEVGVSTDDAVVLRACSPRSGARDAVSTSTPSRVLHFQKRSAYRHSTPPRALHFQKRSAFRHSTPQRVLRFQERSAFRRSTLLHASSAASSQPSVRPPPPQDVLDCNDVFNSLDLTRDGRIDYDDIAEFVRHRNALRPDAEQPPEPEARPHGA
jgi:hypothetical protein